MRVLVIGAGGHGQVVADVLMAAFRNGSADYPFGYADHDETLWGHMLLNVPVMGSIDDCASFLHDAIIVGVGDNRTRRRLFEAFSRSQERFVTACHPSAVVSANAVIRHGTVVCAGAIVNAGTCVGSNVILNTACSVDHHNVIGDHAHIAPGVRLGGNVTIGQGALIGIGAIVLPGRRVGAWTTVGAGAVVTQDLPDGVMAVGSPARAVTLKATRISVNH
jgi:sugar O-acyltransferase (sialic acid O-acetyltransferase NeuD family)